MDRVGEHPVANEPKLDDDEVMLRRRLVAGLASSFVIVMLCNCSAAHEVTGHMTVTIVDDTHLSVGVGCPAVVPSISIAENATDVRIVASVPAEGFMCLVSVTRTLSAPLGTRSIIDGRDGSLIYIDRDQRCSSNLQGKRCDGIRSGRLPN